MQFSSFYSWSQYHQNFTLACAGKKEKTDQNITVDDDIDYGDDHDDRTIKMILLDHCGLTSNINLRVGGCFYQKSHPTHHIWHSSTSLARWVQLTAVSRVEEPVCVQPFRLQVRQISCHLTPDFSHPSPDLLSISTRFQSQITRSLVTYHQISVTHHQIFWQISPDFCHPSPEDSFFYQSGHTCLSAMWNLHQANTLGISLSLDTHLYLKIFCLELEQLLWFFILLSEFAVASRDYGSLQVIVASLPKHISLKLLSNGTTHWKVFSTVSISDKIAERNHFTLLTSLSNTARGGVSENIKH